MSNYYDYREVKTMIAHRLMEIEGWKVYGYSPDESDSMTDYYSPAYWDGIAEKNGYILCVDVCGAREPKEIREYNYSNFSYSQDILEKIKKLESMTMGRGASEEEERSAKEKILKLHQKAEQETENRNKYIVTGMVPGHMAHPSKCNWHIEKDGIIIAKGNGILKYRSVESYFNYDHYKKSYEEFKKNADKWEKDNAKDLFCKGYYDTEEKAEKIAKSHRKDMEEVSKIIESFNGFINKLDTTCGGLLGEGDGIIYEKVTVTEFKKEFKAVESSGSIEEGQCFILKSNFNYGHNKGQVFKIHETERNGIKYYHAYKLNRKRTKECMGTADSSNRWTTFNEKFLKWIEQGIISWCEIQEVKIPYEVEKVIKKKVSNGTKVEKAEVKEENVSEKTTVTEVENLTFTTVEDTDTRTGEIIFLVKVTEKLSREEYQKVNKYIKSIGGYYSKFKHAFLFTEDPTILLNSKKVETVSTEEPEKITTEPEHKIKYDITEDIHTSTGVKIWLVKIDGILNKLDFAEEKQKLATLKGYYSSFKKAFIFKYDPTEKLIEN